MKNIIFDWSGTLSDDLTPVFNATNLVFQRLGREPISLDEYRREFTLPYMNFWNKYFPELTREEADRLYFEAIEEVEEPRIYPGVEKKLRELSLRRINMAVISSHPHDKLVREAVSYGIRDYFMDIDGSIPDKLEVVLGILGIHGFSPLETMYVGDMTHDIDAGRKAGVLTVGITWGYQTREKLKEADLIIDSLEELVV